MIARVSASAPAGASAPVDPELRKAAVAFEALLLRQLIGTMRKGSFGEDIFGSSASATYREMADARTADALAQRGAFGIAALIERQIGATLPSSSGEALRDLAFSMPSRSGAGAFSPRATLTSPTSTPPLKGAGFRSEP
jgi:flagellar protein FlgJ